MNGEINWDDWYWDGDDWKEYGDFDIFEDAVPDETDNYLYYNPISEDKKKPFWDLVGGKVYGLAIIWIVLSTKPWK